MKVLVVGSGGREHALVWKLAQDSAKPQLFCAPGNAGTALLAQNLPVAADDVEGLLAWAKEARPDLTVVGPEAPLCAGLVDAFTAAGLAAFGPCQAAAQIEGSKLFAKEVMRAAGVPTAHARAFDDLAAAIAALDEFELPVVLKADGLAAGKGVIIAEDRATAEAAIRAMLVDEAFGKAGARVLIESFLVGEEASILALVDGESAVLLPPSQDHKRVFNGDQGPNTGGMGAYTPIPLIDDAMLPEIKERVILPVVRELKRRGITYKGVLYAGLMVGPSGIQVLEFNARFGDPETQAVLLRIGGDLLPALRACVDGTLQESHIELLPQAAATVVLASGGYPGEFPKGLPISGLKEAATLPDVVVFHGGTARRDGEVVTAGGRVLAVSALGDDLPQAVKCAYAAIDKISFEGAHWRTDIAARAFAP